MFLRCYLKGYYRFYQWADFFWGEYDTPHYSGTFAYAAANVMAIAMFLLIVGRIIGVPDLLLRAPNWVYWGGGFVMAGLHYLFIVRPEKYSAYFKEFRKESSSQRRLGMALAGLYFFAVIIGSIVLAALLLAPSET